MPAYVAGGTGHGLLRHIRLKPLEAVAETAVISSGAQRSRDGSRGRCERRENSAATSALHPLGDNPVFWKWISATVPKIGNRVQRKSADIQSANSEPRREDSALRVAFPFQILFLFLFLIAPPLRAEEYDQEYE